MRMGNMCVGARQSLREMVYPDDAQDRTYKDAVAKFSEWEV